MKKILFGVILGLGLFGASSCSKNHKEDLIICNTPLCSTSWNKDSVLYSNGWSKYTDTTTWTFNSNFEFIGKFGASGLPETSIWSYDTNTDTLHNLYGSFKIDFLNDSVILVSGESEFSKFKKIN